MNSLELLFFGEFAINSVHPLLSGSGFNRISDEDVDDGVDIPEFLAMRFLCFGGRFGVGRGSI